MKELDKTRLERMTSIDGESGHALLVAASAEGDFSNNSCDPGSYLTAVRQDLASAFAPAPSLPPAVQGTNPIAKPLRIQETPGLTPGRTPIHGRPIILRNLHKHASSLLTQEETSRLLRSLTQRDIAILQALHDYRYLNTLQIQQLFFHGVRSAQMRLQFLSNHGLIYRWQMIDPPGLTRRPSLLLLTPRGGRLLAEFRGHSLWSYIRRAEDARDHCWHVTHDLEANGFFVDLALASRLHLDQGLWLWIGEESSRSSRRTWAREHRRPIATPDGEGLYLSGDRTITFDLEWDRGTESIGRLRSKLRTYVGSTRTPKAPTANTCCLSCIGRVARNCFTDWPVSSFLLGAIAAGSGPQRSSESTTSARWARSGLRSDDATRRRMTTSNWTTRSRSTLNAFIANA